MTHEFESGGFGRRGALAAFLGTAAVAAAAGSAQAAPSSNVRLRSGLDAPDGSPTTATIASAPVPGYAYRTVMYLDFHTLDPSSQARTFVGVGGAYGAGVLEATVEIPAGALLRNIEWYVANSSGSDATMYAALWTPASGFVNLFAPATIPSGSGLVAVRVDTTGANWGPYPDGSKIVLYAPTSSANLLNGARLAFSGGGLETNLLATPITIYNSSVAGGIFTAGETRTIPVTDVPVGTTGAILRVITSGSASFGNVKIFAASLAEPVAGAATIIANAQNINEVTVRFVTNRQLKVKPSRASHVRLDMIGWLR